ncbi:MAG: transposase [Deferribacteres bacterium]|nr:transposase [Deferribacteres bacterium]
MSEKFKGKYRNESARLQNWDYGRDAAYFITICTKNREHYFGEIENSKMRFTPAGAIAHVLWHEIKHHAKNIELGEFVVMPNHVHGMIILNGNDAGTGDDVVGTGHAVGTTDDVGTTHALSLPPDAPPPPPNDQPPTGEKTVGQNRFQNQGKNTISSMIGSYKSAVTKHCNRLDLPFAWQPRFHDHIIRDEKSFLRISEYIKNNPANWAQDILR